MAFIFSIAIAVAVLFFMFAFTTDFDALAAVLKQEKFIETDLSAVCTKNYFGKFISTTAVLDAGSDGHTKLSIKLFNFLKIGRKDVAIIKPKQVYAGGNVVAMMLKPEGLIVTKISTVRTSNGEKSSFENGKIKEGDIILTLDSKKVENLADIKQVLAAAKTNTIEAKILRGGEELILDCTPQHSLAFGEKRLGIYLRDDFGGIGTLTYIDESDRFGALGHSIAVGNNTPAIEKGRLTKADFMSIEKAGKGKAGQLRALENMGEDAALGEIDKNCKIGVFGTLKNKNFIKSLAKYEVGGRYSVKPGNAKILAKIDDEPPREYNIKILRCAKQSKSESRGIVIKITDRHLIEKTGGIVQGMSGSPILQGGRIVGAVTHVFLNNATKGYGVYLDFMLEQ